jgi:transposase
MDTMSKQGTRKGRPNYSREFKRQLAIAACAPDVSVSKLALAHEVNANMVFKWRRQYRAGLFDIDTAPAFLPVSVMAEADHDHCEAQVETPAQTQNSTIEIVIADAIVRVHGAVNAKALRAVVQSLRA